MFSSNFSRSGFPLLPPYGAHDPEGMRHLQPNSITPYLGLRARLSQVWINRWTVLLLLVLVRVLLGAQSLQADMAAAKIEALSACNSVESMGSTMASMPHYMAAGTNKLAAHGVTEAIHGLAELLLLTIIGVEEIILFYIDFLVRTYMCLITLVINGSVEVAVSLIKDVTDFLNKTLAPIEQAISEGVSYFKGVTSLFGNTDVLDSLSTQSNQLKQVQLPSSIDTELDKINSTVQNFDNFDLVKSIATNVTQDALGPLKTKINDTLGSYQVNTSVFPVPSKVQLSFCSDNDGINSFFDDIASIIIIARKIFIAVIVIAAILACIPMAYREIWRWRTMKARSLLVQKEAHDPMDVVYIVSRPYTSTAGIKAASFFGDSRKQILIRWVIAYATSIPALVLLSLGLAGLFSCLCQYILLRSIEKAVPELTAEVTGFADKVVDSLNNASEYWATDINGAIGSINHDINDHLFGWVNTSAKAVNDTINQFLNATNYLVNVTLGGTLLDQPVQGLLNCLIEMKLISVQKGLTWLTDHAHIDFPELPNNTFSIGAAASLADKNGNSFLSNPSSQASDEITAAINRVTNKVQDSIQKETAISTTVVLLWVFVALLGVFRALILCCIREKNRGEGGGGAPMPPPSNNLDNLARPPPFSNRNVNAGQAPAASNKLNAFTRPPPFNNQGVNAGQATTAFAVDPTEESYQMQKLGFAGQRDYETALNRDASPAARGSSYAKFEDEKKR